MAFGWRADGGPFWLLGIVFLGNTDTDPLPICKINNKKKDKQMENIKEIKKKNKHHKFGHLRP